ncbi:MAG TPA: hypothetical protein VGQ64_10945 [Candidatus Limnocylindrales bacterium]|nr:hypothetical protein [Candidatus Limnocylindrales bacterium]
MAERVLGLRHVVFAAGMCVVVVAASAAITWLLPPDLRSVVFRTPLLIVILILGTALALWRIARPGPPDAQNHSGPPNPPGE